MHGATAATPRKAVFQPAAWRMTEFGVIRPAYSQHDPRRGPWRPYTGPAHRTAHTAKKKHKKPQPQSIWKSGVPSPRLRPEAHFPGTRYQAWPHRSSVTRTARIPLRKNRASFRFSQHYRSRPRSSARAPCRACPSARAPAALGRRVRLPPRAAPRSLRARQTLAPLGPPAHSPPPLRALQGT